MKKILPVAIALSASLVSQAYAAKPIETRRMVEINNVSFTEAAIMPQTLQKLVCKNLPKYCSTPVKFFFPENHMFADINKNTYYAFGVNDPLVIKIDMVGFRGTGHLQGMSNAKLSYADLSIYNGHHPHKFLENNFKIDAALYPVAGNPAVDHNVWAAALLRNRVDGGQVTEADFLRVDFVDAGSEPANPHLYFRHIPFSPEPASLNMKPTLQIDYDYKGNASRYDWVFKTADRQWQRYNGLGRFVLNFSKIKLYHRNDKGWGTNPHVMNTPFRKGMR